METLRSLLRSHQDDQAKESLRARRLSTRIEHLESDAPQLPEVQSRVALELVRDLKSQLEVERTEAPISQRRACAFAEYILTVADSRHVVMSEEAACYDQIVTESEGVFALMVLRHIKAAELTYIENLYIFSSDFVDPLQLSGQPIDDRVVVEKRRLPFVGMIPRLVAADELADPDFLLEKAYDMNKLRPELTYWQSVAPEVHATGVVSDEWPLNRPLKIMGGLQAGEIVPASIVKLP